MYLVAHNVSTDMPSVFRSSVRLSFQRFPALCKGRWGGEQSSVHQEEEGNSYREDSVMAGLGNPSLTGQIQRRTQRNVLILSHGPWQTYQRNHPSTCIGAVSVAPRPTTVSDTSDPFHVPRSEPISSTAHIHPSDTLGLHKYRSNFPLKDKSSLGRKAPDSL